MSSDGTEGTPALHRRQVSTIHRAAASLSSSARGSHKGLTVKRVRSVDIEMIMNGEILWSMVDRTIDDYRIQGV